MATVIIQQNVHTRTHVRCIFGTARYVFTPPPVPALATWAGAHTRQKRAGPSSLARRTYQDLCVVCYTRQRHASPSSRRAETDVFAVRQERVEYAALCHAPRTQKALPPTGADSHNQSL